MAEELTLFDLADLVPKPPRPARPPEWASFPDGPDRSDHEPDGWTGPCLYASPARGLVARLTEWALWQELYGSFASGCDSHAWHPAGAMMSEAAAEVQLDRHDVFLLDCDLRRFREDQKLPLPPCGHGDAERDTWLRYRSVCRKTGCDWESAADRHNENAAVEDGMDHAHPGWRTLPPVPRIPDNWFGTSKASQKSRAAWEAKVNEIYPDGWLEAGGPIRTLRQEHGTRHVEHHTPYGGYDLALTCHLCGAAENLTWLTGGGVTVAGCKDGCPEKGNEDG